MNRNYFYCKTCNTIVDFFKYDSLEDTGHDTCDIRDLTNKELKEAMAECKKDGCFEEFCLYGDGER